MMRHPTRRGPAGQRGVTLIELMVAVVIGLIVTAGAAQIFLSSRQGYRNIDAVSRLQENGRYAMRFMRTDIRMADFFGCSDDVTINNRLDSTSASNAGVDFSGPSVTGTESGTTDEITVRGGTSDSTRNIASEPPSTSAPIELTDRTGIEEGQTAIITNCEQGDLFVLSHKPGDKINKTPNNIQNTQLTNDGTDFSQTWGQEAMFMGVSQRTYRVDTANNTLVREVNGDNEALVSGVEGMNIRYGVDTLGSDQSANAYLDADQVSDWEDVVSVRIELLMRSAEDNILDTPQDYTFPLGSGTTTAGDRRLRQVFSATVGIRNRLP